MARLVSLNVGLPKEVAWRGETVRTGIWKYPVAGKRMVSRLNVDGDEQADKEGHGGPNRAVFVYQLDSYRYWAQWLGRADFTHGQFGENFTVDGLPDDGVCIGDRFRVGRALFEVSQPRVTCFRLGIRLDEPEMPSLVVAHHRPGFYLRTLEEGTVEAGDEIVKVASGDEQMTVAEIDGLLYLPRRTRRQLQRALRIPALSEGWRGSFEELLQQHAAGTAPPRPAWSGFRALRVTAVEEETATIRSIRFEPVVAGAVAPALPGQFLTVRVPQPGGAPVLRSYSLSGSPRSGLRISVKREGTASRYLHDSLGVGDVLEAGAPRGAFVLVPAGRPILLISAGVGATPVLAMLHALAEQRFDHPVWWVHGARDGASMPFAAEVRELLDELPQARRLICFSRPGHEDRANFDFDVASHLDAGVMDEFDLPRDADVYTCGPGPFMRDISAALIARGTPPERLHSEMFGPSAALTPGVVPGGDVPAPHPPPTGDANGATGAPVVFARSNLSVRWDPTYHSLLELAEACDVPVRWSCRTGVCHTCQTDVVEGGVEYVPAPLEPPPDATALLCCARPRGREELILDL